MKDHLIKNSGNKLYLQLIADYYNCTWENAGEPGVCNRRIIRTSARDALDLGPGSMMLISLTYWGRTEKYSETEKFGIDEFHVSVKPNGGHQDFYKSWAKYTDEKAELSNLCADLVMLSNMLDHRGIKYLIYCHKNLSDNDLSFFKNSRFGIELTSNPQILNVFDTSLCQKLGSGDWFYDGSIGHLSADGHNQAAKTLISQLDAQE
jgi:hypothetical protein